MCAWHRVEARLFIHVFLNQANLVVGNARFEIKMIFVWLGICNIYITNCKNERLFLDFTWLKIPPPKIAIMICTDWCTAMHSFLCSNNTAPRNCRSARVAGPGAQLSAAQLGHRMRQYSRAATENVFRK